MVAPIPMTYEPDAVGYSPLESRPDCNDWYCYMKAGSSDPLVRMTSVFKNSITSYSLQQHKALLKEHLEMPHCTATLQDRHTSSLAGQSHYNTGVSGNSTDDPRKVQAVWGNGGVDRIPPRRTSTRRSCLARTHCHNIRKSCAP